MMMIVMMMIIVVFKARKLESTIHHWSACQLGFKGRLP